MAQSIESMFRRTYQHNGGTFNPDTYDDVTSGYVVAIVDGTWAKRHAETITSDEFVGLVLQLQREYPSATIGTWIDADTDMMHIDPVDIFTNRDDAISEGIARHQLAIFNLDSGEEISL